MLLVAGGFGMAFFTGCFAVATSDLFNYREDKTIAYLIIAFTACYVINFAYSWGPLGWVVRGGSQTSRPRLLAWARQVSSVAGSLCTLVLVLSGRGVRTFLYGVLSRLSLCVS